MSELCVVVRSHPGEIERALERIREHPEVVAAQPVGRSGAAVVKVRTATLRDAHRFVASVLRLASGVQSVEAVREAAEWPMDVRAALCALDRAPVRRRRATRVNP